MPPLDSLQSSRGNIYTSNFHGKVSFDTAQYDRYFAELIEGCRGSFFYSFLEGNSNQPRKKTMGRALTGSQGRMVRFLNLECLVLTPRLLIVLG